MKKNKHLINSILSKKILVPSVVVALIGVLVMGCSKSSDTVNNNNNPQGPQTPAGSSFFDVQKFARPGHTVYQQIALQPDGKLIALRYGSFYDTLFRLLPSGEIDTQFSLFKFSNNDVITELRTLPDGKILLEGKLSLAGNPGLIRLSANGQFEKNLLTINGSASLNCMMVQPDGKILVGGNFSSGSTYKMIRIDKDGVLDNTFKSPFASSDGAVMQICMDSRGRIVVGGRIPIDGDAASPRDVVRLNPDGSLDQSFNFKDHIAVPWAGSMYSTIVRSLAVDKQDRVLIGGDFLEIRRPDGARISCNNIVRILANGALDKDFTYADKGPGRVTAILPLSNEDVVVGRNYPQAVLGFPNESVNLYSPRGEYRNFSLGFHDGYVTDILQETPSKILVAGGFSNSPDPQVGLCRLTQK